MVHRLAEGISATRRLSPAELFAGVQSRWIALLPGVPHHLPRRATLCTLSAASYHADRALGHAGYILHVAVQAFPFPRQLLQGIRVERVSATGFWFSWWGQN